MPANVSATNTKNSASRGIKSSTLLIDARGRNNPALEESNVQMPVKVSATNTKNYVSRDIKLSILLIDANGEYS